MARLNRAGRPHLARGLTALGAGGFALLLAGCGGGSSTLTPTGVAGPAATGSKRVAATLKIKIPPKRAAEGARSPKYVSPATQSIAVSFTPAAGGNAQTFNQNLTPGSPGCTASLVSPLICVVTLSLAPASYVANFTTYDGVLDHNGDPQGNVLSQNQGAAVTIAPAAANSINVTLQGVPAGVAIAPVGGTAAAQRNAGAFTIDKCFTTQKFEIVGVDADGDYIVGPGAPAVSLTGGTGLVTIAGPSQASPNLFTVTRSGLPVGLTTLALSATLTPGTGGPAAAAPSTLALTFNTSNCGVGSLVAPGSFAGPSDAVSDAQGNVYVADSTAGAVKKVSANGGAVTTVAPSSFITPDALTIDASGNLFVADAVDGSIKEVSPNQTVTPIASGFSFPTGIAAAPDGNLYVADDVTDQLTLIVLSGNLQHVSIGSGFADLSSVALDSSGTVYVADELKGILQIEGSSQLTVAPGNALIVQPFGIAVDAVGNIYFSDLSLGAVNKIAPGGVVTTFASGFFEPQGVSVAANGDIYIADINGSAVYRYR
jgi:sugar lactone lactonase YvrE